MTTTEFWLPKKVASNAHLLQHMIECMSRSLTVLYLRTGRLFLYLDWFSTPSNKFFICRNPVFCTPTDTGENKALSIPSQYTSTEAREVFRWMVDFYGGTKVWMCKITDFYKELKASVIYTVWRGRQSNDKSMSVLKVFCIVHKKPCSWNSYLFY